MARHTSEYMTTKEVAELLRIKERRLYDLASNGEIPCTRALGKLLFQRSQINAWLASHGTGIAPAPPIAPQLPRVLLGAQDPVLEWALREAGSGIATFLDGSFDGLDRFAAREGVAACTHIYASETEEWNRPIIAERFAAENVVLLEWAWRQRGLIVAPGNPKGVQSLKDMRDLRIVPWPPNTENHALMSDLLAKSAISDKRIQFVTAARTEADGALSVADGQADAAFGLLTFARQYRLDFIPLIRERVDLLIRRSEWFEEPLQKLARFVQSDAFREKASAMEGYDFSNVWRVHFNARTP